MVREHRVADPREMRRLAHVVAVAACPDKRVVRKVPHGVPALLLRARQNSAECGDVLVVPCVAISDGRAFGHTGDLVPVVPPSHDACILRSVIPDPLVAADVVVDDHLFPGAELGLEHELRIGHLLRHPVAMGDEVLHVALRLVIGCHQDCSSNRCSDRSVHEPQALGKPIFELSEVFDLASDHHRPAVVPERPYDRAHPSRTCWRWLLLNNLGLEADQSQELLDAPIRDDADGEACEHRYDGAADDDQSGHLQRVVVCHSSVQERYDLAWGSLMPAEEQTHDCKVSRVAEVHLVRLRVRRRVFCDGVHQRVASFHRFQEQAADPRAERHEDAQLHEHVGNRCASGAQSCEDEHAESEEPGPGHRRLHPAAVHVAQLEDLIPQENQKRRHLLHRTERSPADDGYLHRPYGADEVIERVSPVDRGVVLTQADQRGRM
mmetsp:Transcript_83110/g.209499  ORF Transcript_83110/g.209499 Transcript_83110/m.209499 type:complete len:436 (-) Transcript_83110:807-2114(-)